MDRSDLTYFCDVLVMSCLFAGSVIKDHCEDKVSAVLHRWYIELKNCLAEDDKIKTGCGVLSVYLLFTVFPTVSFI